MIERVNCRDSEANRETARTSRLWVRVAGRRMSLARKGAGDRLLELSNVDAVILVGLRP
jgi:hypothetical protein